jgi:hypothetical protein
VTLRSGRRRRSPAVSTPQAAKVHARWRISYPRSGPSHCGHHRRRCADERSPSASRQRASSASLHHGPTRVLAFRCIQLAGPPRRAMPSAAASASGPGQVSAAAAADDDAAAAAARFLPPPICTKHSAATAAAADVGTSIPPRLRARRTPPAPPCRPRRTRMPTRLRSKARRPRCRCSHGQHPHTSTPT